MDSGEEDVFSEVLELSAQLQEDLSKKELVCHRLIIRNYIEKILDSNKFRIDIDFQSGLDWINTSKPLKLQGTNKIKVLDFFTYCCINCLHIFPQLKELERKFPIKDGVIVVGVHTPKFSNEQSTDNIKAAVSRYDITHPVVNDSSEHLWNTFGICCWPTLVILSPLNDLMLYIVGENEQRLLQMFVEETHKVCCERQLIDRNDMSEIINVAPRIISEKLNFPGKVAVTKNHLGLLIAIADTGNNRLMITNETGNIQYIIGSGERGLKDGGFDTAQFHSPQGLVFSDPSTLYVADTENHAIRKVDIAAGRVETVVGDGTQGQDKVGGKTGREQQISSPWDVALLNQDILLIAMAGLHQIWAYFIHGAILWKRMFRAGTCGAVAGSGLEENRNNTYPLKAGFAQPSGLTIAGERRTAADVDGTMVHEVSLLDAQTVYVADSESSSVRAVSVLNGQVTNVVGGMTDPRNLFAFGDKDGIGYNVKLQHPLAVAWSPHSGVLYVCDSYNHKLKLINPSPRQCLTFITGQFNEPGGMCAIDNLLYIADTNNHCIKTVNLDTMTVETLSIKGMRRKEQSEGTLPPVKEQHVEINSEGGLLELNVSVTVAEGIKPLPESPARWILALPEGWKELKVEDRGSLDKTWTLEVAAPESATRILLRPQCQLFYCHNNLCSRRTFPFFIKVSFSDTAPRNVSCSVPFLFSL